MRGILPTSRNQQLILKTDESSYSSHLQSRSSTWWKRLLPVQYPYRRLVRQVFRQGPVLDVGCGFGRLLQALPAGSVGVDHNPDLIAAGLAHGLDIVDADGFSRRFGGSDQPFRGLLCAHVIEHLEPEQALRILGGYLRKVKPGGTVMLVTPQACGYRTDPTHVHYYDATALEAFAVELGLQVDRNLSYPLHPAAGRFFAYNENVILARLPQ
jgi:2-polyprenyl-3-methyl-5-hydroxy-6-metoxy-1,4-benzoquinol methylase